MIPMFVEFVSTISNSLIETFRKTSNNISNYDMYLPNLASVPIMPTYVCVLNIITNIHYRHQKV